MSEEATRDASRITSTVTDIDSSSVAAFFAARAIHAGGPNPLAAVIYQDRHPELARERDAHERAFAVPRLKLDGARVALDVGCGIGRWAPDIIDHGVDYLGTDFSPELLQHARSAHRHPSARFVHLAAQGISPGTLGRKDFDRVLMAGLLIYLNDADIRRVLHGIESVCAPSALLYVREPAAVTTRLTLKGHWSEEMSAHYNAIYRSDTELESLLTDTLLLAGFEVVDHGDLYPEHLNNRSETRQIYYILERRA